MSAMMDPMHRVLPRLNRVKFVHEEQWCAECPVCDAADGHRKRHLYIGRLTRTELPHVGLDCKRGCATKDILAAIGLTERDLFWHTGRRPERTLPTSHADWLHERYAQGGRAGPAPRKLTALMHWLTTQLRETLPSEEVYRQVWKAGIPACKQTIRDAYHALGGQPRKAGFKEGWVCDPLQTPAARMARGEPPILHETPADENNEHGEGPILNEHGRFPRARIYADFYEEPEFPEKCDLVTLQREMESLSANTAWTVEA